MGCEKLFKFQLWPFGISCRLNNLGDFRLEKQLFSLHTQTKIIFLGRVTGQLYNEHTNWSGRSIKVLSITSRWTGCRSWNGFQELVVDAEYTSSSLKLNWSPRRPWSRGSKCSLLLMRGKGRRPKTERLGGGMGISFEYQETDKLVTERQRHFLSPD